MDLNQTQILIGILKNILIGIKKIMKTLIIGAGEIGKSLNMILQKHYVTKIRDKKNKFTDEKFNILHICFPYGKNFVKNVMVYYEQYKPEFVVIHSTVPVGTTRGFGQNCFVHSPAMGRHPNLVKSIQTFEKFIGYNHLGTGEVIKKYF